MQLAQVREFSGTGALVTFSALTTYACIFTGSGIVRVLWTVCTLFGFIDEEKDAVKLIP